MTSNYRNKQIIQWKYIQYTTELSKIELCKVFSYQGFTFLVVHLLAIEDVGSSPTSEYKNDERQGTLVPVCKQIVTI